MPGCPFCTVPESRILWCDPHALAISDLFPVSPGHTLFIPRRHCETWFDTTAAEQQSIFTGIQHIKTQLDAAHRPQGYNIGINAGAAAGQTIFHCHVHLIPRYEDDVPDPRGGVRWVIPSRGNYLGTSLGTTPHEKAIVRGEDDALLPHLRAHIDVAQRVDIAVAFILQSGVDALLESFRDFLKRGGQLRILTGDYLDVTDPDALARLIDLRAEGSLTLRVFDGQALAFHPKSYIFRNADGQGVGYVGSSNLSASALRTGVEWNMRIVSSRDGEGFAHMLQAYESLFVHEHTQVLDERWVEAYRARRRLEQQMVTQRTSAHRMSISERQLGRIAEDEPVRPVFQPHAIQQEALDALEETRRDGNRAGLVVLATGIGKTWLAAFDSSLFERVLFVAHREEILGQALQTFRRIRPEARLGLYTGTEKVPDADVLFASIQTLGRDVHLQRFARDAFDYIVVDEFHHASARTYRKLIDWFDPQFFLGLTATPERTDGGDLLALCQENLVFRCDLAEGIRRGLLCPFEYYGVPDNVDYANIPWRNSRFDVAELEAAVATEKRAQNALEQYRKHGGARTLAFCVGQRHAEYMASYFAQNGLKAVAVHAGETSAPRTTSLEQLARGELDVICAVDMFNEGVDVPALDTVMMLRPTESRVLWLQQLGRGLRLPGDGTQKVLKVIDYIGNHRSFLMKPQVLLGSLLDLRNPWSRIELREALDQAQRGELELPPGCAVTYDLEALDLLAALMPLKHEDVLRSYYVDFREVEGRRPTAAETLHDGYNPRTARETYGSWLDMVRVMGDLDADQQRAFEAHRDFLVELETTPMTKSYKMLLLQAMVSLDALPGTVSLGDLSAAFARAARRSSLLARDVAVDLDNLTALARMLEKNPINAWTGGNKGQPSPWFAYVGQAFRTVFAVGDGDREAFKVLVGELLEWRIGDYLRRSAVAMHVGVAQLKVSQSNGRPILFLDRSRNPWLPKGWLPVKIDGEIYELNFVKIAVNVARRPGTSANVLGDVLRNMLGPHAGQPGTSGYLVLENAGDEWTLIRE